MTEDELNKKLGEADKLYQAYQDKPQPFAGRWKKLMKACQLLEEIADPPHSYLKAQALLGHICFLETRKRSALLQVIPKNHEQTLMYTSELKTKFEKNALHYLAAAANAGDPRAMYEYGAMLLLKDNKSIVESERRHMLLHTYFHPAAKKGVKAAISAIFIFYKHKNDALSKGPDDDNISYFKKLLFHEYLIVRKFNRVNGSVKFDQKQLRQHNAVLIEGTAKSLTSKEVRELLADDTMKISDATLQVLAKHHKKALKQHVWNSLDWVNMSCDLTTNLGRFFNTNTGLFVQRKVTTTRDALLERQKVLLSQSSNVRVFDSIRPDLL